MEPVNNEHQLITEFWSNIENIKSVCMTNPEAIQNDVLTFLQMIKERNQIITSIQQERDKLISSIKRATSLLDNPMAAGAYKAGVLDALREIVGEERT